MNRATDIDGERETTIKVLLLSGGIDSAAIAHWIRPHHTLFIAYGQRPNVAEARAAEAVARQLNLNHATVHVDLRQVGGGLLTDDHTNDGWPSPEWWPYRNQLLLSIAAAWSIKHVPGATDHVHVELVTGTVASDGARHADGTASFYELANDLLEFQEGNVAVTTPAIGLTSDELVRVSEVGDSVLGWTHSCHRANAPCGECPGCHKRAQVLKDLNRLQ